MGCWRRLSPREPPITELSMDEFQLFQVMEAAAHHCQSYAHGLRDTISKDTKEFDRGIQSTLIDRWLKPAIDTTPVTPEGVSN